MGRSVLSASQRNKEDCSDDALFYLHPRFSHHLDEGFRSRLKQLYCQYITEGSIVLDLMSSWVSHLPENIKYKKVIGHGLNKKELESNKALDSFWIQNLNIDRTLPLSDSSIDFCLMVAAWQYLQYPEEIASELRRIIRPKGILIVSFSNRAFWTKTPFIWKSSSDEERINYVCDVLISEGWSDIKVVNEKPSSNYFRSLLGDLGDPFYSIIAQ